MSIRKVIRQLIMEEVKDSNFIPSAEEGEGGRINFEDKLWKMDIFGIPVPVLKIESKGGSYKITIETPYIPFISEGSKKLIEIRGDASDLFKKGLISNQDFSINVEDPKGKKQAKISFSLGQKQNNSKISKMS